MRNQEEKSIRSTSRRAFLQHGLNASIGAGAALSCYSLFGGPAFADDFTRQADLFARRKEEVLKEKLAKSVFHFCSPYYTSDYQTTPHAHHEIKALIEQYTNNKVYVKIHDGGQKGIGSSLASRVKHGHCQGALLSVSNLALMVKELDILNIPFWSACETEYVRLFNSEIWKNQILSKTRQNNIQVLFPYVVGARTATTLRYSNKVISSPQDFKNMMFRVPGSQAL
ncbi:MAG: TRAP-type C4-dicarboxylate transport system substrate-binding protein, partial [Phenylobacterium sp.]